MTRPRLVVHGHFYQPSRIDPATGLVPVDPTAAPARDWNARIAADCYRPNAELGNLGRISWDLGPTLAGYLEGRPVAYRGFVTGDDGVNGLAQPFHHTILPLATTADRRTEIRWGLRDFELRFGRRPTGLWLPETAVDLETLRLLVDEGVTHTILAPWQVTAPDLDTRRAHRVELGDGRSIVVALYDAGLSTSVSFEPDATADADRFARERVGAAARAADAPGDPPPFALIATDGELYGHHQPFRDLFLAAPRRRRRDLGLRRRRRSPTWSREDRPAASGRPARRTHLVELPPRRRPLGRGCGCVPTARGRRRSGPPSTGWPRRSTPRPSWSPGPCRARPTRGRRATPTSTSSSAHVDGVAFAGAMAGPATPTRTRGDGSSTSWPRSAGASRCTRSCGWFWESSDRIETALVIRAASTPRGWSTACRARAWRSARRRHRRGPGRESVSPRPARHGLTREAGRRNDHPGSRTSEVVA